MIYTCIINIVLFFFKLKYDILEGGGITETSFSV